MHAALTRTLIASPLPEASWFSAAEAALAAIYALHPAPEQVGGLRNGGERQGFLPKVILGALQWWPGLLFCGARQILRTVQCRLRNIPSASMLRALSHPAAAVRGGAEAHGGTCL